MILPLCGRFLWYAVGKVCRVSEVCQQNTLSVLHPAVRTLDPVLRHPVSRFAGSVSQKRVWLCESRRR